MTDGGKPLAGAPSVRMLMAFWLAVALVFLTGSVLSVVAWSINRASEAAAVRRHFDNEVRDVLTHLATRMAAHEQLLRAGIGLFAASEDVSRAEWRIFCEQMRLQDQYPGLTALGYAPLEMAPVAARAMYLEPAEGRSDAESGFDLLSDPVLRSAMLQARDTGLAVVTGKRTGAAAAVPGRSLGQTLLFMPIYKREAPLDSPEQRQAALQGFIFAAFGFDELMRSLMDREGGTLAVELFDGQHVDPAQRVYGVRTEQRDGARATFDEAHPVRMGLQHWTMRIATLPAFDAEQPQGRAGLVLLGGLVLTLLVTALVGVLASLRSRALALAGRMSEAFQRSERTASELERINAVILQSAPFMVITADPGGTIRTVNPAGERMLQYERDELVGRSITETLMLPGELAEHARRTAEDLGAEVAPHTFGARAQRGLPDESEWNFRRKDGTHLPVNVALAAMRDGPGSLTGFVGIAYDITERKKSEEYILHLAHHDALTGLPNRVLLQDRVKVAIERGKRHGHCVAVVLLDLDRFKQINDSLGHFMGDAVLKTTANRLTGAVRHSDTVARMGGDEFCLVLSDLHDDTEAVAVAAKVLEAVRPPIPVGQEALYVTASIGIAMFPHDGPDLTTLLQNADTALYRTKDEGRNGFRVFDASMQMQAGSLQRLALEADLRSALARGELLLHYQPKVRLDGGEVVGLEALLRWNSPERGMIAPAQFIALAEDTGLIVPIGEWVLRQACVDAMALRGELGLELGVAVNLSPRQFRDAGLVAVVQQVLRETGLPAGDLELEITEGVLMDNTNLATSMLDELHRLGVRLAIDDFGTGFSSLSYLHRFPVSTLKIDRSFVADLEHKPQNRAIVASVIGLGQALSMHVVAEGIETAGEWALLREQGCDAGQGYYFGRPLPFEEVQALLRRQQALNGAVR